MGAGSECHQRRASLGARKNSQQEPQGTRATENGSNVPRPGPGHRLSTLCGLGHAGGGDPDSPRPSALHCAMTNPTYSSGRHTRLGLTDVALELVGQDKHWCLEESESGRWDKWPLTASSWTLGSSHGYLFLGVSGFPPVKRKHSLLPD